MYPRPAEILRDAGILYATIFAIGVMAGVVPLGEYVILVATGTAVYLLAGRASAWARSASPVSTQKSVRPRPAVRR